MTEDPRRSAGAHSVVAGRSLWTFVPAASTMLLIRICVDASLSALSSSRVSILAGELLADAVDTRLVILALFKVRYQVASVREIGIEMVSD